MYVRPTPLLGGANMTMLLQLLIYGVQLGSTYALLAIGYTMVFGIIRMINMAHGDFLMIGSYTAFFMVSLFFTEADINPLITLLVLLVTTVITGMIGVGIERMAYKPLRDRPKISSMISAIGVSLVIQNLFRALPFIGPNPRSFPALIPATQFEIGGIVFDTARLIIVGLTVIIMLMLYIIIMKTDFGMQMRAASCDKDASALMGVDIDRVISTTFFIGAGLAAISGIFYANSYPVIQVTMGSILGIKSLTAAVVGGIGDIRGALLGGYAMGIIEILVTTVNSELAYGASFIILVLILLFRPEGLLGKPSIEKV